MSAPFEPLVPLRRITVSIVFYKLVFRHFPKTEKNPAYRNLLWYLFWGTYFDDDTQRRLLCREILAKLAGEPLLNFEAGNFLREFDNEVLGGQRLICTPADWEKGKCRQLLELRLGDFRRIFENESRRRWHKRGRVYLDGQKFSRAKTLLVRHRQKRDAERLKPDCDDAKRIQKYLHALPLHLFTENCKKNYSAAVGYVSATLRGNYQQREFTILKYLDTQPKPFYSATENGNSVRLFTSQSIPNLQRQVRKVFTRGWIEADLKC